jgi:hypothetical protein
MTSRPEDWVFSPHRRRGWVITAKLEVQKWFRKIEIVEGFLVRDGDLPHVPHPYYRVAPRVYLTRGRQFASVWLYEEAAHTYLKKHNLSGQITEVRTLPTGEQTNDGRKKFIAV